MLIQGLNNSSLQTEVWFAKQNLVEDFMVYICPIVILFELKDM